MHILETLNIDGKITVKEKKGSNMKTNRTLAGRQAGRQAGSKLIED